MPKPRGGQQHSSGSRFNELQDYYDHDERKPKKDHGTVRRVSFKNTQNNSTHPLKGRLAEMAIRSRLEEDDEMSEGFSKFDERAGSRRKGSPIPKGKFGNYRKLIMNPFGWYQVTVTQGANYSKDELIRALLAAISPDIFIPYYWRTDKNNVSFFVDDFATANRLQQFERGLQMPNGQRVFIRTRSNSPYTPIDGEIKQKMKLAMAERYNAHMKLLDLSRFHLDPQFKGIFVGLFRSQVMAAAVDIIVENIPELVALYLNDNVLTSLDGFKNISQRLPNLQAIHLANNKIPSLAHILTLRNVPIIELNLEGNPLRQRYKDKTSYISEVRRKFTKLQKLDGELLTPEIRFVELSDHSALPEPKASYLCEPSAANVIREFLETYFKLYDSDNRSPLMAAYHPEAMFSLSVPPASQAGKLLKYWSFNRNLMRITSQNVNVNEHVLKYRLLKVGNLPIVATLTELPKTQHELQTFSVDLTLYVEGKMMIFTVCGLFKEIDIAATNGGELRYFRRDFVVVPNGPGSFCIRNEMLFVTSATYTQSRAFSQIRNASANLSQAPSTSAMAMAAAGGNNNMASSSSSIQNRLQMQQQSPNVAQISQSMLPQPAAAGQQLDDNTKMQMVQALSAHSTMNLEWSKKCLEETNWDYNQAVYAFDQLQKGGKIPPDAFIK